MALTTQSGGGSLTSTQNPQLSAASTGDGTQSSSVQPGTASSALTTSQGGLSLSPGSLTTVSLDGSENSTSATTSETVGGQVTPVQHHINSALIIISAIFLVVAAVTAWSANRSEKITTK